MSKRAKEYHISCWRDDYDYTGEEEEESIIYGPYHHVYKNGKWVIISEENEQASSKPSNNISKKQWDRIKEEDDV